MATQREIAEHLNLSTRRVRDVLILLSLPTRGADLDEVRIKYLNHLRELAAGHGAPGGELDLAHERAALARAQREQIELAMRVRHQELVDAADMRRELASAATGVKSAILAVPVRIAAVIAAETDPERVFDRLTRELEIALEALAGRADQIDRGLSGGDTDDDR